ncbi:MAG: hypothetical protein QOG54_2144 [Actinomycetota bacterium]|jgi:hypothetical protein|nr:hypothetical protein [Actinomycetota bacterium]
MSARRDDDLERALVELGRSIDLPAEPDLAPRVIAQIRSGVRPETTRAPIFARRGFVYATAVTVALATALLVFSPSTRHAVADFLGIGGVRVEYTNEPPPGIAMDLHLGDRVSLDEAGARVDFGLRVPEVLGPPPEIYVQKETPTVFVSMIWPATQDLPRATSTGVGALLTQFRSHVEQDFIKKLTQTKVEVIQVTAEGVEGYWVEGPHSFMLLDAQGRPQEDSARLSGNTLIWEKNGVTYRLEGDFDRATAIRIANSMG